MSIEAPRDHAYTVMVTWTGNTGAGTAAYRSYARAHDIQVHGKPALKGSSDPAFLGDKSCYNPEEMLVGSLSACHMLWYLHLCSAEGIVVEAYQDIAEGVMAGDAEGGGRFYGGGAAGPRSGWRPGRTRERRGRCMRGRTGGASLRIR